MKAFILFFALSFGAATSHAQPACTDSTSQVVSRRCLSRAATGSARVLTPTPMPRGVNCPSIGTAIGGATLATMLLVVPVSGIAGAKAEDGWKAGRWAFYTGAAWSYGVTGYLITRPRCHSTDGMAYIWSPIVATAGAFIATRF